ncbi:DegV family protein [Paenibacillus albidus]|nr:DegV family protein [Paenibacillus albidus]
MSLLQIFTDSLADLPKVFMEQHQIQLVPVYVVFNNDRVFKDKWIYLLIRFAKWYSNRGKFPA